MTDPTETAARASCSHCGAFGAAGVELPDGWSLVTSDRGVGLLCASCTRTNVRSIEAKLDEEWWG